MIRFFKKQFFHILISIGTILVFTGMFFLNDIVKTIRMIELNNYLMDINRESSQVDQIGMLAKYKLHKKLYEAKITDSEFDHEELKAARLITSFGEMTGEADTVSGTVAHTVLAVLNFFRMLLDKPPLSLHYNNAMAMNNEIIIAYYLERNKEYRQALEKYAQILKEHGVKDDLVPTILLHEGFCYSIINDYPEAKKRYRKIITDYSNESISMVALTLLKYLEDFEMEINKVKKSGESAFSKSEKLYKLLSYNDAIQILDGIVADDRESSAKINYLKARCNEESGKKEESVKIYQELIMNDHTSEIARSSNRRILVISSLDEKAENLTALSKKNNELIRDPAFKELLETAEKIKTPAAVKQPGTGTPLPGKERSGKEENAQADAATALNDDFTVYIEKACQGVDQTIKLTVATPVPTHAALPTVSPTQQTVQAAAGRNISAAARKIKPAATRAVTDAPTRQMTPVPAPASTFVFAGEPQLTTRVIKDEQGKVKKVESLLYIENLQKYAEYFYNDAGKLEQVKKYDNAGNLVEYYEYLYDKNGNPAELRKFDKHGTLIE